MTIAITGARGRLGRYIAGKLDEKGHDVIRFSREEDHEHRPLSELTGVLSNTRFDAILHLGWSTVPATAEMIPGQEWVDDLPLLRNILNSLRRNSSNSHLGPHFVFFSSCSVYGEASPGELFDESARTHPKAWYAQGKIHAEELIRRFGVTYGIDNLILRISNPYGFRQPVKKQQGVIPRLIRSAKFSEKFVMWGDGSAIKDYLHIDDLYHALEQALTRRVTGTLNVARGQSISLTTLTQLVSTLMERPLLVEKSAAKCWDVQQSFIDIKKAEEILQWVPNIDIKSGLKRYINEIA
jgi:UDP-glucose 4-epimerase